VRGERTPTEMTVERRTKREDGVVFKRNDGQRLEELNEAAALAEGYLERRATSSRYEQTSLLLRYLTRLLHFSS
jgi:hypothetical protein